VITVNHIARLPDTSEVNRNSTSHPSAGIFLQELNFSFPYGEMNFKSDKTNDRKRSPESFLHKTDVSASSMDGLACTPDGSVCTPDGSARKTNSPSRSLNGSASSPDDRASFLGVLQPRRTIRRARRIVRREQKRISLSLFEQKMAFLLENGYHVNQFF